MQRLAGRLAKLESLLALLYLAFLPISMTAAWAVFIGGIVVWLVSDAFRLATRQTGSGHCPFWKAPLALPLVLFAAVVTISGAINSSSAWAAPGASPPTEALQSLWGLKTLLPYFWSFRVFSRQPELLRPGVLTFLSVTCIAGVWGTIQQVFNIHPGYPYLQATGFLGGPMQFAGQMQMASMLILGLAGAEIFAPGASMQNNLRRLCSTPLPILAAGNMLGVLFAGERSAWLGAGFGILFLLGMFSRRSLVWGILILAISGLLAWSFIPLVKTRINSLFSGNDVSITARITIWDHCFKLIPESPLLGIGIRNFPHFNIKEAIVPGVSTDLNHAHSNYIHVTTTTGFIGLAAFLNLFAQVYLLGRRRLLTYADVPFRRGLTIGLLAGVTSLLVAGIFEYNFGTSQVRMTEFFLLGLL